MRCFAIVVEPFGSLFVGGYAQATGADAETAADPLGMLLPGSAVKGALRESAVRLVNAAGRGDELRRRLFGEVDQPGLLRLGTLRPQLAGEAPAATAGFSGSVRNHVSLERATRQAAAHRLFQHRVTPALPTLRFTGVLEASEDLTAEELALLGCAAQITDQIGGGRGRGLGLVTLSISALAAPAPPPISAPTAGAPLLPDPVASGATYLLLTLEAEEPLHLAGVKDQTNYAPSRDYLDGSALRGAVAAALAADGAESALEQLLGTPRPAVFGDARPGAPGAVPAPLTLRVPKRGGPPADEAVRLCAEACGGSLGAVGAGAWREDTRAAVGTFLPAVGGWAPVNLLRRTITRTARDAASGRSADGKLFSLEVLDPAWVAAESTDGTGASATPAPAPAGRLRFYAPVHGTPEQLALVLRASRHGLIVGGERSYGCGRLRLAAAGTTAPLAACAERHAAWARRVGALGVAAPEATGALLAVGPLAVTQERLLAGLRRVGLELRDGVARRQIHGGWNACVRLPRTLSSHFVPGSTFIVASQDGRCALAALTKLEADGVGPGRADGWGRLVACHPIHVDCHQEA